MEPTPRRRLTVAWFLLPILLVGMFLRLHRLAEVSYWFDESFCIKMAEFSAGEIWHRSAQDTHPPFFFLLLKGWGIVFGTSPAAARGLSVVCGLATIVGAFLFVREAYGPVAIRRPGGGGERSDDAETTTGGLRSAPYETHESSSALCAALTAAALVALSPMQIEWSLMVRMYALAATLAVFSAWFLLRALGRSEARRGDWCLFAVTAVMLAGTHYYGSFTLGAEFVFAAGFLLLRNRQACGDATRPRRAMPFAISFSLVAIEWGALLPACLEQRRRVMQAFWTHPLDMQTLGTTFFQVFGVHEWDGGPSFEGLLIAQAVAGGLLLLLLSGRGHPGDIFLTLAAGLPLVAAVSLSLIGRNIVVAHYFLQIHLFLLIGGAVLLNRVPFRPLRLSTILLALAGMSLLSWKHYERRDALTAKPGMQEAIARFDEARQAGEPLIICNPMLYTSAVAYTHHRNACFVEPGSYPFFHGTAVMRADEYFPPGPLALEEFRAVWTLGANDWMGSNWDVSMPEGWKAAGDWRFPEYYCGELVLRMYEREKGD
jgi:hypothetical protein